MEREFKLTKEQVRAGAAAPGGWNKIIATREGDLIYIYEVAVKETPESLGSHMLEHD